MSYKEVRAKYSSKLQEKSSFIQDIQSLEQNLDEIRSLQGQVSQKMQSALVTERESALQEHVRRTLAPIESEFFEINRNIQNLQSEYNRNKSTLSEDEIYEELKKKDGISSEIGGAIDEVREIIAQDLGDRFTEEFISQIPPQSVDLDARSLSKLFSRFTRLKRQVEKVSRKDDNGWLDRFSSGLDDVVRNKLENDKRGILIFSAIAFVVILLAAWLVFPLYVIYLSVKVVRGIQRGALYSRAMVEYKIVSENIGKLDELIRKKAVDKTKVLSEEMDTEYHESYNELSEEANRTKLNIVETKQEAHRTFVFDQSVISGRYETQLAELSRRSDVTLSEIQSKKEKINAVEDELQELKLELEQELGNLRLKYLDLSKVGEDKILDTEFLVDTVNGKPVMYNFMQETALFLYDNRVSATNFMRLLISQLRIRMAPGNLNIALWDTNTLGVHFNQYREESEQADSLFRIYSSKPAIQENIDLILDSVVKRSEIVLKQSTNITEYNQLMIELDSATEFYQFLFVLDPSDDLLSDTKLHQIMINGATVGVYPLFFIPVDSLDDKYEPFIKKVEHAYEISDNVLKRRARKFVLDNLVKFDK
jgi:hypothetical protein